MVNHNHHLTSCFLLVFLFFISCNSDVCSNQKITIRIANELQECEENNLHFTILKVDNNDCKYLEGQIVLPVLNKSINNQKNNELLFPAETLKRKLFIVEGYYSKREHTNISDGCLGSHSFNITAIVESKVLNDEYDYPINYK